MAFHPYPRLIRKLFNAYRFGPPSRFTGTSSWTGVDRKVSRLARATQCRLLRLAFASAPALLGLNLAARGQLVGSLCKRHAVTVSPPLRQVVGARFQGLFHSPRGVLFTFPSRYSFAIGLQGVLSLGGWSRLLRAGFHVPRATRDAAMLELSLPVRGCHPLWPAFPGRSGSSLSHVSRSHNPARALTRAVWARPLSLAATRGVTCLFSPPAATKMFQFTAFAHLSVSPLGGVPPFGHPRVNGCLRLAGEFRRLSRPSSPLGARASSVRPCLLLFSGRAASAAAPVSPVMMSMCVSGLCAPPWK